MGGTGNIQIIPMGVTQPWRGHIREAQAATSHMLEPSYQAAAKRPMNHPHYPPKKRLFKSPGPSGSAKILPSALSTSSQGISKQLKLLMQPCPGHPSPNSCSSTLQFFRVKTKSWLFQDPPHLRISFAI